MSIESIKRKLNRINEELLRPLLSLEDKGRLSLAKQKLTAELSILEQSAIDGLDGLYSEEINEVSDQYNQSKLLITNFNKQIQKELKVANKGIEALKVVRDLIAEQGQQVLAVHRAESNHTIPKTNDYSQYLVPQHIRQAVVCDFFKAIGVSFNEIDRFKNIFLNGGCRKENITELVGVLGAIKMSDVNIPNWYMDHHKVESNISKSVQDIVKGTEA